MQTIVCDIDNVKDLITVSFNDDNTFLCPNCKRSLVKRFENKYSPINKFPNTDGGTCSFCNHTFYKVLLKHNESEKY